MPSLFHQPTSEVKFEGEKKYVSSLQDQAQFLNSLQAWSQLCCTIQFSITLEYKLLLNGDVTWIWLCIRLDVRSWTRPLRQNRCKCVLHVASASECT